MYTIKGKKAEVGMIKIPRRGGGFAKPYYSSWNRKTAAVYCQILIFFINLKATAVG